jgi:hypothetical protein
VIRSSSGVPILSAEDREAAWQAALAEAARPARLSATDREWITVRTTDLAGLLLVTDAATPAATAMVRRLGEALAGAAPTTAATLLAVLRDGDGGDR